MNRRILSIITLSLVIGAALFITSDRSSQAQSQMLAVADTGIVTLGANQILRIAVDPSDPSGNTFLRFKQTKYGQGACTSDGVCKHTIASQSTSAPVTLDSSEAASFDIPASFLGGVYVGVRGEVLSSRRNVQMNASIIDIVTGNTIAVLSTRHDTVKN